MSSLEQNVSHQGAIAASMSSRPPHFTTPWSMSRSTRRTIASRLTAMAALAVALTSSPVMAEVIIVDGCIAGKVMNEFTGECEVIDILPGDGSAGTGGSGDTHDGDGDTGPDPGGIGGGDQDDDENREEVCEERYAASYAYAYERRDFCRSMLVTNAIHYAKHFCGEGHTFKGCIGEYESHYSFFNEKCDLTWIELTEEMDKEFNRCVLR